MSSGPGMSLQRTLGLRLSVWYAAVLVLSTLALVAVTYALLASSLAQRDHDIIRATVREYASRYELGGLLALRRAVELEERTGDRERLFVRVIGPGASALFARMPQRLERLRAGGSRRWSRPTWRTYWPTTARRCSRSPRSSCSDGTILQVGKSNEIRLALLRKFQWIVGLVSIGALAVGVIGGLVLTRSTVHPIYDLIAVVQGIIRTGRTDTRVPGSQRPRRRG